MKAAHNQLAYCRLIIIVTAILQFNAIYKLAMPVYLDGRLFSTPKWLIAVLINIILIFLELILLAASWYSYKQQIINACDAITNFLSRMKLVLIGFLVILIPAWFSYIIFSPYHYYFDFRYVRLFWLWIAVVLLSFLIQSLQTRKVPTISPNWWLAISSSLLFVTAVFKAFSYLPNISTYPFSLYWSEGSHYYYASLFFSKKIYGFQVPLPPLHGTRYLMQSFPFLFNIKAIWFHRTWEVFLWIGTSVLTAFLLTRRLAIADSLKKWSLIAWLFIFLLLGPVYFHLQVMVILVLWGFRTSDSQQQWKYFFRNTVFIILASIWAGVSRLNWFPLPATLAITLYLLETPLKKSPPRDLNAREQLSPGKFSWLTYFFQPVIWFIVGITTALVSQALYIHWSGNPPEFFATSFSSDLLWYRLFPNNTYPPGILPMTLFITAPMIMSITLLSLTA